MQGLLLALLTLAPPAAAAPKAAGPSFETLARQADQARDANRLDEALSLYRQAVKIKPDWDEGWWAIGTIAYDQDKYAECAPAFRRFTALKPGFAPAWILSGMCEYHLRHFASAYQSLLRADTLGFQATPDLARAGRLHLVFLLTKNGNFERALALCTFLCRNNAISPEVIAAAGVAGLGRSLLLSEVPKVDRPLVLALGNALAAAWAKPSAEAVAKFQSALESYPDVAAIHYRFGAFLLKNEPARGLAEIKRALELDPLHIPSLVTLALDCLNSGDYETARRYGQQAVQAAPGNYASHLMLGRAYLLESKSRELEVPPEKAAAPEKSAPAKKSGPPGKPQPRPTPLKDAVRELETAVKLEPDSLDAHYNLSAAYALAGRTADVARERAECERLKELARARTGL